MPTSNLVSASQGTSLAQITNTTYKQVLAHTHGREDMHAHAHPWLRMLHEDASLSAHLTPPDSAGSSLFPLHHSYLHDHTLQPVTVVYKSTIPLWTSLLKAKCIPLLITVSPAPGSTWQLENVQEMYADGRKMLRQEGKNERRRVKGQEPFFMYLCTCPKMCIHRLLAYSRLSLLVTHTTYQIYIECLLCTRWREDISTWLMHVVSDLSITTQGI